MVADVRCGSRCYFLPLPSRVCVTHSPLQVNISIAMRSLCVLTLEVTMPLPAGTPVHARANEQDFYVAVHASLPPPGAFSPPRGQHRLHTLDLSRSLWLYDRFFYLALLPKELDSSGPLAPLCFTWANVPLCKVVYEGVVDDDGERAGGADEGEAPALELLLGPGDSGAEREHRARLLAVRLQL